MLGKLRNTMGTVRELRSRRAARLRLPVRWPWAWRPGWRALLAVPGILALVLGVLALWAPAGPPPPEQEAHVLPGKVAVATPTSKPVWTPGPLPPTPEPDNFNLLLLGCDEADPSWRTDAIMVAAIRPRDGYVGLFSIPRDLWVTIPGYREERINAADYHGESVDGPGGGPALVAATLQKNLGIETRGYVRIRFDGLARIVDALGGVDITAARAYPDDRIPAGPQHMDGKTALNYARNRTYTSDLDRGRRQQELLLAMRQAAQRPAVLLQLPKLLAALPDVVLTDLPPSQILSLADLALRLKPEAIHTRTFDEAMVENWTTPDGWMVLLPHRDLIEQAWREVAAGE